MYMYIFIYIYKWCIYDVLFTLKTVVLLSCLGRLLSPSVDLSWHPSVASEEQTINIVVERMCLRRLPSGKHTKSYWKWQFIVDFPIKIWWFSIAMLNYQRVHELRNPTLTGQESERRQESPAIYETSPNMLLQKLALVFFLATFVGKYPAPTFTLW